MRHSIVAQGVGKFYGMPANHGENGPNWQNGMHLLVGATYGKADVNRRFHQLSDKCEPKSLLFESINGGDAWTKLSPLGYVLAADKECVASILPKKPLDFTDPAFLMRVVGDGYHGHRGTHWLYSVDFGKSWCGPYGFGDLFSHPELENKRCTARTATVTDGVHSMRLFLSVRDEQVQTEHVCVAKTCDGGQSFMYEGRITEPTADTESIMPAPVVLASGRTVVAVRTINRIEQTAVIDLYGDSDGRHWHWLGTVANTGVEHGSAPAMVMTKDGICALCYGDRTERVIACRFGSPYDKKWSEPFVLRSDFYSCNGEPDLGYPRLFVREDGLLCAVYFWCTHTMPYTHIASTVFRAKTDDL